MTREQAISNLKRAKCVPYKKETLETTIKALEEKPKTGHWIDTGSGQECSECHEIQYGYDNYRRFCANCGAKMNIV